MKKSNFILLLFFLTCMILTGTQKSEAVSSSRIILYTYYRQMGWGDRVQIGCVDENGVIRTLNGHDSSLKWPYKPEEQLEYLSHTEKFSEESTMTHDDLFSVKSLILSVEDRGNKSVPAANDAGTEKSYAVRYSPEGEPVFILLGMSGDDFFENSDPNAQALYLLLRRLFPSVTTYAFSPMGPQGFVPVPLADFTGIDPVAAGNAVIEGFLSDCEEGNIPLDLTAQDKAGLVSLVWSGTVTGKADCISSTGGSYTFTFSDPDRGQIGTITLEDGLLVMENGRYFFKIP